MSLRPLVAKADMTCRHAYKTPLFLSTSGKYIKRLLGVVGVAFFVSSCATDPVVPPTELASIQIESKLDRLWTRKLEKSEKGRFQPLVLDGVIYAASRAGEVIAIEQESGKRKWIRNLNVSLSSGVGGSDGRVYVSTSEGLIKALNTTDGKTAWAAQASSEVLAPVSAGFDSVIVRSADGRLLSLNPETGEELWSVTYTPPALTINGYSRPLLLDGGVLVGLDDGRLLALNSASGSVLWESVVSVPAGRSEVERLADIDGSIRVDNSAIYAVNYQGRLARIEPAKGQIMWSVPMSSTAGLAISDTAIFVVGDDDEVHAFDKAGGQLLWTQSALKHRRLSAPQVVSGNLVLVGDLEGYLHTLSADDGRLVGRSRVAKKSVFPEISSAENTIIVQAADGTVAALRPKQ